MSAAAEAKPRRREARDAARLRTADAQASTRRAAARRPKSPAAEAKPREARSARRRAIENGRGAGVNVAGSCKEANQGGGRGEAEGRRAKRASPGD